MFANRLARALLTLLPVFVPAARAEAQASRGSAAVSLGVGTGVTHGLNFHGTLAVTSRRIAAEVRDAYYFGTAEDLREAALLGGIVWALSTGTSIRLTAGPSRVAIRACTANCELTSEGETVHATRYVAGLAFGIDAGLMRFSSIPNTTGIFIHANVNGTQSVMSFGVRGGLGLSW